MSAFNGETRTEGRERRLFSRPSKKATGDEQGGLNPALCSTNMIYDVDAFGHSRNNIWWYFMDS